MNEGARTAAVAASAWGRARERLARRRLFRGALAVLALLGALAVYAPFLANDRPYYLEAVHVADYERARKSLVPVSEAVLGLAARSEAEFLAARPQGSNQTLDEARAAELAALATRLATLARHLDRAHGDELAGFRAELETLATRPAPPAPGERERLARRAAELGAALDPARIALVPAVSSPLLAALTPLEVGLAVAWLWVLAWPLWRARLAARSVVCLAPASGLLAALAWSWLVGGGSAFASAPIKEGLTRGEIRATHAVFAPLAYGFAEQHPEESLRPPTWLASSELDARGAYVAGARVPAADRVTGFVPATRPVEIRAGEPALNSPWRHLLGTDTSGRDQLARLIHGARASLGVAALSTALLVLVGLCVGALAGGAGGVLDLVLSRLIEVVVSFPLFFLVLVAVALLGPSSWNVVLVLGCVGWTGVARLTRAELLRQRELAYVEAARSLGYSPLRIVLRHMLPNALAPVLVAATFAVASAILVESALSFLGYGVRVPVPSWGALTSESRDLAYWWLQLFPGLALFVTVLCVQLVGDALRDALDPRVEERA